MAELTYAQAINLGIREEMRRDAKSYGDGRRRRASTAACLA